MLQIYIARHGEDQDNINGILNGRRDTPLTQKGQSQAKEVALRINKAGLKFDAIYTSPLTRTRQTAQIISNSIHGPNPEILDVLTERDFGSMTGKPRKDIITLCAPDILTTEHIVYFLKPENGETFPDLLSRAAITLTEITNKHEDGSILLVTHGDVGKMIYAKYYNLSWQNTLKQFHFGNAELLLLSQDSPASDSHVFKIEQMRV